IFDTLLYFYFTLIVWIVSSFIVTYHFVRTFFNSNQNESLDDIIQRLIINDSKKSSVNTDEITNSRS
ncbi:MAG: hypothetical protein K2I06_04240, partial [Ruminococcus sp.]|nr:hypothetical protein [Ruminococcus sp.]